MTNAVRHCMECRFRKFDPARQPSQSTIASKVGYNKDPLEAILELTSLMSDSDYDYYYDYEDVSQLLASFIKNPESILQELDVQRLRAIIYRDVVRPDRSKSNKSVVAVVVNQASFLSYPMLYMFFNILILFLCFFCVNQLFIRHVNMNVFHVLGRCKTFAIFSIGYCIFCIGTYGFKISRYY